MTRLDRIDPELLPLGNKVVKEMLDVIEPPIDRRGSQLSASLLLDEVINVAPREFSLGLVGFGKEQA